MLQEEEGDTKTPLSGGAVKLKKSNIDNNEKIKEMHIQIDFPTFSTRSGEGSDNIWYWESIHFTILSNLGSKFDCEFTMSYRYPEHEKVGRLMYKLIIDGYEIQNILYDLKISDNKGGLSSQKVGIDWPQKISFMDYAYSKEFVLKDFGPFLSGDQSVPNRVMGSIKIEFRKNDRYKKQETDEFEEDRYKKQESEFEDDYDYDRECKE